MKFFSFATLTTTALILTCTTAAPSYTNDQPSKDYSPSKNDNNPNPPPPWSPFTPDEPNCLTKPIATELVNQFASLISSFDASVASTLLHPTNFTDTSDSINTLSHVPSGTTTFPNATAFIAGQGSQPAVPFKVLAIDAVTCAGVVAFRWLATVGPAAAAVNGLNVLYASNAGDRSSIGPGAWQLTAVYSEFNSAVWMAAVGGTCSLPPRSV